MKKTISMLLCGALLAGVMAGCSGGTKQQGGSAAQGGSANAQGANMTIEEGVLKVGMECAYAPYNWTQTDDKNGAVPIANSQGEYAFGYDVMVAKKLAEGMGLELEIYKTEWGGLPPAVSTGKLDCAIAGQSTTADRLTTVDFTEPYYYATVVALARKDTVFANAKTLADFEGTNPKCTAQLDTIWYPLLNKIPSANIQPAQESAPAMLTALSSGKVDVIVSDMPTCRGAEVADSNLKIIELEGENPFGAKQEDINIGVSLRKGNTELKEKMDAILTTWTEEDRTEMMEEAIRVQPMNQ